MARFAGDNIADYMKSKNRPNFGKMSMAADNIETEEETTYNELGSQVGAKGITAQADVTANGIVQEAKAAAAQAQGDAQAMGAIGKIGSSLIGAIPSFGGGGGGGGGTLGYDYSDFSSSMNANPFR